MRNWKNSVQLSTRNCKIARQEYENYRAAVTNTDGNDTVDTSPTYKVLEEGASTLSGRRKLADWLSGR